MPGELADGLALLGAPARAPAEDVLCGAARLEELPPGARVGTSSIRRLAQLRSARADLDVVPLRGNVDTRLRKLAEPREELAAIVLARAGLERLARGAEAGGVLDPARFVPAPGQGTLALEGRAGDERARAAVSAITEEGALASLLAERSLARELGASCHTPLGAHALAAADGGMLLRAWVGLPDGSAWVADELLGAGGEPEALGAEVAARMSAAGAREMLRRAQETAGVAGA
jgi:hydroxymethylbilane synthase